MITPDFDNFASRSYYGIKVLFMNRASLLCLSSILFAVFHYNAAETANTNNKTGLSGLPAMCDAAAPHLRDAKTDSIVLTIELDDQGRVHSFRTNSPEGLRLEEVKKAADEIKAMRFEPAKKDGRPVWVMIRAAFKCPAPAAGASKG